MNRLLDAGRLLVFFSLKPRYSHQLTLTLFLPMAVLPTPLPHPHFAGSVTVNLARAVVMAMFRRARIPALGSARIK
jgi:hypothetical protein